MMEAHHGQQELMVTSVKNDFNNNVKPESKVKYKHVCDLKMSSEFTRVTFYPLSLPPTLDPRRVRRDYLKYIHPFLIPLIELSSETEREVFDVRSVENDVGRVRRT